jgi:hypothetical protein
MIFNDKVTNYCKYHQNLENSFFIMKRKYFDGGFYYNKDSIFIFKLLKGKKIIMMRIID